MEIHEITLRAIDVCTELVADAIIKRTHPMRDDISEREARKRYGTRWLRIQKQKGILHPAYVGRRVVYSRHELDCAVAAGKENYLEVMKSIRKDGE